jgi:formate dehydrogenase assembly factor FdhD
MNYNYNDSKNVNSNEEIMNVRGNENSKQSEIENNERKGIIKKTQINRFYTYLCFLCARKRKNIQNILLDEGMKIIIEKLDIMNLFKKIYKDEKLQEMLDDKDEYIEMTDECKLKLYDILKNSLYGF